MYVYLEFERNSLFFTPQSKFPFSIEALLEGAIKIGRKGNSNTTRTTNSNTIIEQQIWLHFIVFNLFQMHLASDEILNRILIFGSQMTKK
jgi:hypothetical protein